MSGLYAAITASGVAPGSIGWVAFQRSKVTPILLSSAAISAASRLSNCGVSGLLSVPASPYRLSLPMPP